MKNLLIILILVVVGFIGYRVFLSEQGPPMVPYGKTPAYGNEGTREIKARGMFFAREYIVPGRPTVFDFCTENSPACRRLHDKRYPDLLQLRPDVAVRYVRLSEDWSPQGAYGQYRLNINDVPHIIIYGPDGKLIAQDEGEDNSGEDFFKKWFRDELEKKWKRKLTGK